MDGRKFTFGDDLRGPRAPMRERTAAEEERHAAVAAAYARGVNDGRSEAHGTTERRLVDALDRLGIQVRVAIDGQDRMIAEIEDEALQFFMALARKLAGDAVAARPLATIAETAVEAFRHLRGVPHLAVRVHDTLVEDADRMLKTLARERGFEGRIIVLGDDQIGQGDTRIEWADGGVVRDAAALDEAVRRTLAATPSRPVMSNEAHRS